MDRDGFTLTELMVVIAIISILLSLATISYLHWLHKYNIESQVKTMYADLTTLRAKALYEKSGGRSVRIGPTGLSFYDNVIESDDTATLPERQTALNFPVITSMSKLQIDFDQSGVATFNNDTSKFDAYICIQPSDPDAVYDSIIVSKTRLQVGKLTGSGCSSGNVTAK